MRRGGSREHRRGCESQPVCCLCDPFRYGFETAVNAFHGLDQRSMDEYFQFMQANKFNALRVPFSLKFALNFFDEPVRRATNKQAGRQPVVSKDTARHLAAGGRGRVKRADPPSCGC